MKEERKEYLLNLKNEWQKDFSLIALQKKQMI